MLDTPDLYKKFEEFAKEQVQYDMDNNLIPDYSQFDFLHAEKISKKRYLAVIERLITNCPINNDYKKKKKELQEYTQKYIDESFPPSNPATIFNILNNFKAAESTNILNPTLRAFILYVELIRQMYFYIQEKYIRKTEDKYILLTHSFIQYSLELLNGICSLLLGANHNSVISIYRTFYENFIIFDFLQRHTELTDAFIDHATMDNCILIKEQAKARKIKASPEVEKTYNDLTSKYGKDFRDSYGWTSLVIKEENKRNLRTMFDESNLSESFNYYYKLSCRFSHATAFSLLIRPEFNQLLGFLVEIADIVDREIKTILEKISLKTVKEEALLYNWLGVTTDNFRRELNNAIKPFLSQR